MGLSNLKYLLAISITEIETILSLVYLGEEQFAKILTVYKQLLSFYLNNYCNYLLAIVSENLYRLKYICKVYTREVVLNLKEERAGRGRGKIEDRSKS